MENITINEKNYKLIENFREAFNLDATTERLTDYYDNYDYVVGDWAYGKLRLKGFTKKENKIHNKINDYQNIKKYIEENCAYGCKYFVLERNNID